MQGISVVVPVFNEEGNVRELHKEILEVCKKENYKFEIIFVDDGSKDKTPEICKELKPLKYIRMRKNFGQTAAMDAGIKLAQYDYIVTMDGDRQNDPADIPKLVNYLEENDLDIVSGWRKNRKDTVMKKFTSRVAKIYKKECFDHINLYGEMHRFIPALLRIKGFEVGEVVVNHRPRTAGVTKYNWKRTIKGFVDMISLWFWSKYAVRPLHILGAGGMVSIFLGVVCAIWSIVLFALGYKMSNNIMPPLLTVFFIIVGLLMFIFGLMSDMMSKTYYGSGIDKSYSIKETIENKETEE